MLGSDVAALPSLLPATKASKCKEECEWRGKVPNIQKKMADVFFRLLYFTQDMRTGAPAGLVAFTPGMRTAVIARLLACELFYDPWQACFV